MAKLHVPDMTEGAAFVIKLYSGSTHHCVVGSQGCFPRRQKVRKIITDLCFDIRELVLSPSIFAVSAKLGLYPRRFNLRGLAVPLS